MANTIKIKQSSVSGKVPLAGDLEQGELAINTLDEKLYTKNSTGSVVQLGGAYQNNVAATTAPTASDDSADGYEVGSVWIDITNDKSYTCVDATNSAAVWTQGGGASLVSDTTAPSNPEDGDQWFNSTTGILFVRVDSTWIDVSTSGSGMKYTSGTTAPSSPVDGDHWFDTSTGILAVRIDPAWIDVSTAGAGVAYFSSASAPSSPKEGDQWFQPSSGILYVYLGSNWMDISTAGSGLAEMVEDLTPQLGGNLDTQSFTVDGRDVSTDGTKLDTIETNADVTDTTNVVAALTAGTNVTISGGGTIASTDTTYSVQDGELSENNFTDADHTKLDGIETSADVTDTTNVVAALTAGTNVSISGGGTISSTDTDTTYVSGDFDHDALTNFVANEHIDWTGSSAGTIHLTNLPATALTAISTAASEVAMLALTTEEGDVVVRSDENKTYMHNGGSAGTMADFTVMATPTDAVSSVDGATGAVTLNHDTLTGFVSNEHIDWTTDQGATNIHSSNYTDTNTTYSVQDGELSEINFTSADHSKLNGIASSANNYSHPTGNGNNHIPSNGAANQVLTYSSAGTATWADAAGGGYTNVESIAYQGSSSQYSTTRSLSSLGNPSVVYVTLSGGGGAGGGDTGSSEGPSAAGAGFGHMIPLSINSGATTLTINVGQGGRGTTSTTGAAGGNSTVSDGTTTITATGSSGSTAGTCAQGFSGSNAGSSGSDGFQMGGAGIMGQSFSGSGDYSGRDSSKIIGAGGNRGRRNSGSCDGGDGGHGIVIIYY